MVVVVSGGDGDGGGGFRKYLKWGSSHTLRNS